MSIEAKINKALMTHVNRSEVYGADHSGHHQYGQVMDRLFPNGIHFVKPEDFAKFHLFSMIVAKLCRYAHNYETGHEDSIHDVGVYAFILEDWDMPIDPAPVWPSNNKAGKDE